MLPKKRWLIGKAGPRNTIVGFLISSWYPYSKHETGWRFFTLYFPVMPIRTYFLPTQLRITVLHYLVKFIDQTKKIGKLDFIMSFIHSLGLKSLTNTTTAIHPNATGDSEVSTLKRSPYLLDGIEQH